MASVKGTETEKNLLKSFAGESQARNRYNFFSQVAREEGYVQIANIFDETAYNEQMHGKRFFSFLEGGDLEITASYPAGKIGTTIENLTEAAAGENEEWTHLYPSFAAKAREEGFEAIALLWEKVVVAERQHEKRYLALLKNIQDGRVFKREVKVVWKCDRCGYLHEGTEPPPKCPACAHPQAYFEILAENW